MVYTNKNKLFSQHRNASDSSGNGFLENGITRGRKLEMAVKQGTFC